MIKFGIRNAELFKLRIFVTNSVGADSIFAHCKSNILCEFSVGDGSPVPNRAVIFDIQIFFLSNKTLLSKDEKNPLKTGFYLMYGKPFSAFLR